MPIRNGEVACGYGASCSLHLPASCSHSVDWTCPMQQSALSNAAKVLRLTLTPRRWKTAGVFVRAVARQLEYTDSIIKAKYAEHRTGVIAKKRV